MARAGDVECLTEFRDGEPVGDDPGDVQTGADEGGHGVPSLEDLTAGDSLDRDHVEDDLGHVEGDGLARGSQQGDTTAMGHVVDHGGQGGTRPGHLQADVEALLHVEAVPHRLQALPGDIDGVVQAEPLGQFEPLVGQVGDDDVARPLELGDEGRHDPDGSGSRHEDVLGQAGELQRRVYGIAERVKDRRDVGVEVRDVVDPDVAGRHDEVLAVGPVNRVSDTLGIAAQVSLTGQAGPAAAADVVALTRDELADLQIIDLGTELDDLTAELVSEDQRGVHRLGSPSVPRVDVDVGAADPTAQHLDDDIVRARGRVGNVNEFKPRFRPGLRQGLHGPSPFRGVTPSTTSL